MGPSPIPNISRPRSGFRPLLASPKWNIPPAQVIVLAYTAYEIEDVLDAGFPVFAALWALVRGDNRMLQIYSFGIATVESLVSLNSQKSIGHLQFEFAWTRWM